MDLSRPPWFQSGNIYNRYSRAFDKVDRDNLVVHLRNALVSYKLCDFMEDYLALRQATVIVHGGAFDTFLNR